MAFYATQAFLGPALLDLIAGDAVDDDHRCRSLVIANVNACNPTLEPLSGLQVTATRFAKVTAT